MKSEVKGVEDAQYGTRESVVVARARVQVRALHDSLSEES
jgi:hypothetical protein